MKESSGMRTLPRFVIALTLSCEAFAQSNPASLEFDVVDVKPNKSGELQSSENMLPSGQFLVKNLPINQLLQFAFDVRDNFLLNKPGWVDSDRFDLVGKTDPKTPQESLRIMVQNLLAKEFKMAYHKEERPMNVFAMIVGKGGPKLQDAAAKGESNCKRVGGPVVDGQQHMACTNFKMSDLARALPQMAPAYIDRPVVDLTELKGTYDLQLDWVGMNFIAQGGLTMPDAVAKELGLKLEERKLPMTVIVIDHIEKPVSEN
jgi:uncharacterized protein (TIGR03435 family)